MPPKMVQKHDKKSHGIWNDFCTDFGAILAPFWEPGGAMGSILGAKMDAFGSKFWHNFGNVFWYFVQLRFGTPKSTKGTKKVPKKGPL